MSKKTLKTENKSVVYVEKINMRLYQLRELVINGNNLVTDKLLSEDIPNIILGKFLRTMSNKGFTDVK